MFMYKVNFLRDTTIDGRTLAINSTLIQAVEDKGDTISILLGGQWFDFDMTFAEFFDAVLPSPQQ